eukprot:gene3516-4017_t
MNASIVGHCTFPEITPLYRTTSIITSILAVPLAITAVFGNLCIILALARNKRLQIQSNILLGSLCVTDLLIGMVVQPVFIARRVMELQEDVTASHCVLVDFHKYFSYLMAGSSIVNMALISLDRWFAICHPFKYQKYENKTRYVIIIILTWLAMTALLILPFTGAPAESLYAGAALFVGVSIIIIVACYTNIYLVVLRHKKKIHEQTVSQVEASETRTRRPVEKRRANTIAIIILGLFICYLPHGVIICVRSLRNDPMWVASRWGETFVLMNSSINPIVYCWRSTEIREAVKDMFQRKQ